MPSWLDRVAARLRPGTVPQSRVARAISGTLPFRVPVLLVHYFPVRGDRIDQDVTGDVQDRLADVRAHCLRTSDAVLRALERGSTYHGYKDPTAVPSLDYEVVGSIEYLEALPTWRKWGHRVLMTDYNAIMDRIGAPDWVETTGVKEIWIWGYHGGVVDLWESNMGSPWGDVSNSDRDDGDLPIFDKTFTVYHYNYQRGPSEAVEDHMHQIEAVLRHVDEDLFWGKFVGKRGEGRCGWAHFPPNGEHDYDWANPKTVLTDIEDWMPDGGKKTAMNCERWGCDSLRWFIYWMQNIPGANHGIAYDGRPLTNWWTFIGDYDGAMEAGTSLVA